MTSHERVALNTAVQQALSGAKYDAKTINDVASFATDALRFANACGAVCTMAVGAVTALQNRQQIMRFLEDAS